MPRPPRAFVEGIYHLSSHASDTRHLFLSDGDRKTFLDRLALVIARFDLSLIAYALLGNHYHLVVATPDGRISSALQQLHTWYSRTLNRRRERSAPLPRPLLRPRAEKRRRPPRDLSVRRPESRRGRAGERSVLLALEQRRRQRRSRRACDSSRPRPAPSSARRPRRLATPLPPVHRTRRGSALASATRAAPGSPPAPPARDRCPRSSCRHAARCAHCRPAMT